MIKTKTQKLRALDFTDKFNMCCYMNTYKHDIDIINITHEDGRSPFTSWKVNRTNDKNRELYRS
jgi:hypothetical protein